MGSSHKHSVTDAEGGPEAQPCPRGATENFEEEEVVVFNDVATGELLVSCNSSTPMATQVALVKASRSQSKTKRHGSAMGMWGRRGLWEWELREDDGGMSVARMY